MKNFKNIKLIVYDFDGVMTDNRVYVDHEGREMVQVNRGDGLGVSQIKKLGIEQIIISTEQNQVVAQRAKKLKIICFHGIDNKLSCLNEYAESSQISLENICFVGNDINDLEVMSAVGIKICPLDAADEIKKIADIVINKNGGEGVLRELFNIVKLAKV